VGKFVKGDVVVIPFPFSDLSSSKRRPALVVAIASSKDLVLAQITSQAFCDDYTVKLSDNDFSEGGLRVDSHIRPNKLFTAESSLIAYKAGSLKLQKAKEVAGVIVRLVSVE
jgi:mRNA interferase MazF